jgi:hypothetical protein
MKTTYTAEETKQSLLNLKHKDKFKLHLASETIFTVISAGIDFYVIQDESSDVPWCYTVPSDTLIYKVETLN